jgi:putative membrane protein
MIAIVKKLIGLSLAALVFAGVYWYQRWYIATYHYDLTDQFLIIKKGVIASTEISIPYSKINDVFVEQDILDRILGLYDVHVSSATNISGQTAHIDGVDKHVAMGLRSEILKRISAKS